MSPTQSWTDFSRATVWYAMPEKPEDGSEVVSILALKRQEKKEDFCPELRIMIHFLQLRLVAVVVSSASLNNLITHAQKACPACVKAQQKFRKL